MDVEYRSIGISQLEMNTGQVEGLPSNPRQWTREELDSLKKSLRETHYELLRLAIRHGYRVNGGASRLQKHCEEALSAMGETEVFSYSNATINNGAVYRQLGFSQKKVEGGQPFVMMRDNSLVRLINLYPDSTDSRLARAGRIKTHIGGNRLWTKKIGSEE